MLIFPVGQEDIQVQRSNTPGSRAGQYLPHKGLLSRQPVSFGCGKADLIPAIENLIRDDAAHRPTEHGLARAIDRHEILIRQ